MDKDPFAQDYGPDHMSLVTKLRSVAESKGLEGIGLNVLLVNYVVRKTAETCPTLAEFDRDMETLDWAFDVMKKMRRGMYR